MNIINWIRNIPPIWSYSSSKVGMAISFFESPSLEKAQEEIKYLLLLNLGPDLGVLTWEKLSDEDDDIWALYAFYEEEKSDTLGYLKRVNDRIKDVETAVLRNIQLSDEEKERKKQRIAETKNYYESGGSGRVGGYPPSRPSGLPRGWGTNDNSPYRNFNPRDPSTES